PVPHQEVLIRIALVELDDLYPRGILRTDDGEREPLRSVSLSDSGRSSEDDVLLAHQQRPESGVELLGEGDIIEEIIAIVRQRCFGRGGHLLFVLVKDKRLQLADEVILGCDVGQRLQWGVPRQLPLPLVCPRHRAYMAKFGTIMVVSSLRSDFASSEDHSPAA